MHREKRQTDLEKYKKFLIDYKEKYGQFETIEYTGSGEILMYRDMVELVQATSAIMPSTRLMTTSNLALLTPDLATDLVGAGLKTWQVSLDSVDQGEYKKIVGRNIDVDRIIENIKTLWEVMRQTDPASCRLIVTAHRPLDDNYEEKMKEIEARVYGICSYVATSPYQSLNGRKSGRDFALSEQRLYTKSYRIPCNYLWDDLTVVNDGSVRVCCSDMFDSPVDFGNVFQDPIEQVIDNPNRRKYKQSMLHDHWDDLYLCGKCHAPRS